MHSLGRRLCLVGLAFEPVFLTAPPLELLGIKGKASVVPKLSWLCILLLLNQYLVIYRWINAAGLIRYMNDLKWFIRLIGLRADVVMGLFNGLNLISVKPCSLYCWNKRLVFVRQVADSHQLSSSGMQQGRCHSVFLNTLRKHYLRRL